MSIPGSLISYVGKSFTNPVGAKSSISGPRAVGIGFGALAVGAVATGYGASAIDLYRDASGNLSNEDMRNRYFENKKIGIAGLSDQAAIGTVYAGGIGAATGWAFGAVSSKLMGKSYKAGGIIGAVAGAALGSVIGGTFGAFKENQMRATFTNDYLSNSDRSDVEGARPGYRAPNYITGAVTAGAIGGGGSVLSSRMFNNKMMAGVGIATSIVGGITIGSMMASSTRATAPDKNRIQGLGY